MPPIPKISDYALIGNSRSAALVNKYGSIDWCCLPEFHSPAVFCALLDQNIGGRFLIAPTGEFESEQRYLPDTNVVETIFTTPNGKARIIDAFAVSSEEEKTYTLFPDHEILRVVESICGTVQFKMEYSPTVYFGKILPVLKDNKKLGIKFQLKEDSYVLLSTLNNIKVAGNEAWVQFQLQPGENEIFSFSCSSQSPAVLPEVETTGWKRMNQTINYWKRWIKQCQYEGLYKDQVKRSALALKLLAHAPSGAIIAAPTTSLPEVPGGASNWDYRYCWLRDASFTTRVLVKLGFEAEVHAYMNWILHATQLTRPKLQVVYSVFGNTLLSEKKLFWLHGYQNSRPVRIGNEAYSQLQLDVYGEVLDAVFSYSKLVDMFPHDSRKFIIGLGEAICKQWNQPDNGIWETRSSRAHHTHSRVMAWVGLDRLVKLAKKYYWREASIEKYEIVKDAIKSEVERLGYNNSLKSYTAELKGNSLDASCLVFPLVGYCEASSPKMISTTQLIMDRLTKNKLLCRYFNDDKRHVTSEGAFGICNFWLVENLAKSDNLSDAIHIFQLMMDHASPTGLFSEEIDPFSHELLGNYPQGFTHIGLVNAAFSIDEATKKRNIVS